MFYNYKRFLIVVLRADRIPASGQTGIRDWNPKRRAAVQLDRRTKMVKISYLVIEYFPTAHDNYLL